MSNILYDNTLPESDSENLISALSKNDLRALLAPDLSQACESGFIKFPNDHFHMLNYDDKLIIVWASLFMRKTLFNTVNVSLNDILSDNIVKPAKGPGRNIEQFKNSLFNLMNLKFIMFYDETLKAVVDNQFYLERVNKDLSTTEDFEMLFSSITLNTPLVLRFNELTLKTLTSSNFTILEYRILNILKQACRENKKLRLSTLVNVYLIIKKHILANEYFSDKQWNLSLDTIRKMLRLNKQTVCNTIKVLKNFNVLSVRTENRKNYYSLTNPNNHGNTDDSQEQDNFEVSWEQDNPEVSRKGVINIYDEDDDDFEF